jgi:nicotinamidase-related amidase
MLPDFYDSANAARWDYQPDAARVLAEASAWAKAHGVRPAREDARRVELLLIDVQRDFCFPRGTLYVGGRSGRGALEDNDRIARFVYDNLRAITGVTVTLDTHFPFQIFSPAFWRDAHGNVPAPHQEISADDVRSGRMRPNSDIAVWFGADEAWLRRQVEFYCTELERAGKYRLYLWPPHCLLGGDGHALVGVVQEARLFHAYTRQAPARVEIKGGNPLTENYSVLAPEVRQRFDGAPLAERNASFIRTLLDADAVIIAGQAASHCVKSTIDDLLDEIGRVDKRLASKVHILEDCMSSVAVPDPARPGQFLADFTPQAEEALARWKAAGMRVMKSTEELG